MSVCGGHSGRWEARQICPELALPSKLRPTVSTSRADIAAFAAGTAALGHSQPSFQCVFQSVYRQSAASTVPPAPQPLLHPRAIHPPRPHPRVLLYNMHSRSSLHYTSKCSWYHRGFTFSFLEFGMSGLLKRLDGVLVFIFHLSCFMSRRNPHHCASCPIYCQKKKFTVFFQNKCVTPALLTQINHTILCFMWGRGAKCPTNDRYKINDLNVKRFGSQFKISTFKRKGSPE